MKRINFSGLATWMWLALLGGVMAGCEKDLYDPEYGKNELPSIEDYFGFEMNMDANLSVDYNVSGFKSLIEVYSENPLVEGSRVQKKEGLEPIFSAYTDANGKFDGNMYISASIKEAYLYTKRLGLPACVKLEATVNGFTYDATKSVSTRAATSRTLADFAWEGTKVPYKLTRSGRDRLDNVYSLTKWAQFGGSISPSAIGTDYIEILSALGGEPFGTVVDRVEKYLVDNSANGGNAALVENDGKLNIKTSQGGTEISVTFVGENAQYYNTFGYYYYPTGQTIGKDAFLQLKKYVLFPNASVLGFSGGVVSGSTAKLLYFDEATNTSTVHFPEGYTVGWFLISDGYMQNSFPYDYIRTIDFISYPKFRNACFSNEKSEQQQFISLYDTKTKHFVIGVEDALEGEKDDYIDMLFFVTSTLDTETGEYPVIPDETPQPTVGTEIVKGTLCFEDGWPTGKDYDLNDVVVQYVRIITFDEENYAKSIKETFKFVHKDDAAALDSYFAYHAENLGTIGVKPDDCVIENGTKSIVFKSSAKQNINKEFVVERTFATGTVTKEALKKDFNPYIIVDKLKETNRIEVHLPKYPATSAADPRLISTKDDIYYTDKGGKFPFAIDIPMWDFKLSPETKSISQTYENFDKWVQSGGNEYTEWYKNR